MSNISLTFCPHQPNRLIPYDFFKIGEHAFYEDDALNARALNAVAERCYLPANNMMKQLITLSDGKFRLSYAVSGILLEQASYHRPDLIDSFKELADTGCVEFLAMPYYASLSSLYASDEFAQQIMEHSDLIESLFGQRPRVLYNTALLYSNAIAAQAQEMGFEGILADGQKGLYNANYTNNLYCAPLIAKTKTIACNHQLSMDLAVNRVDQTWAEYPLSPYTFENWVSNQPGRLVSLALDYEILGERQADTTGVFEFWRTFIQASLFNGNSFMTPSEAIDTFPSSGTFDCPQPTSRTSSSDLQQWIGNSMQQSAIKKIYDMEASVKASNDPDMVHVWRKLQSADNFQYMQKEGGDIPYPSPYEAYIYYMNALADLQVRVKTSAALEVYEKRSFLA